MRWKFDLTHNCIHIYCSLCVCVCVGAGLKPTLAPQLWSIAASHLGCKNSPLAPMATTNSMRAMTAGETAFYAHGSRALTGREGKQGSKRLALLSIHAILVANLVCKVSSNVFRNMQTKLMKSYISELCCILVGERYSAPQIPNMRARCTKTCTCKRIVFRIRKQKHYK